MGLIIVFVAAAAAGIALYLCLAPFLASKGDQARADLLDDEIRQVEHLASKKSALLLTLRELEFDHQTDKISDEDYELFRKRYERQAVGVMRELDAIHGGRGWQETIETEIQARLAAAGISEEPAPVEDDVDVRNQEVAAPECSGCNGPLALDDKFCSQCGTPVPTNLAPASEATA